MSSFLKNKHCDWCGKPAIAQTGQFVPEHGKSRIANICNETGFYGRHAGNPVFENDRAFSKWIKKHMKRNVKITKSHGSGVCYHIF